MIRYFDPSAWVKRYFQEQGSEAVNDLFRDSEGVACCRLVFIEMAATIARKCHNESLSQTSVEKLLDDLREDFAEFSVIPVEEEQIVAATDLAIRHRLRTMDALHRACALNLKSLDEVVMVSADLELLAAAAAENLRTLDPGRGPS